MTTETFYRSERGHTVEDGVFLLAYIWAGELPCSPGVDVKTLVSP